MCSAGNLVSICYSHMEWKNDALGICFAHMKYDQYGERPREPWHIYANPLLPEICPILGLGLYLLCVPFEGGHNVKLLPGGNQYDQFRRLLNRVLELEDGLKDIAKSNWGMVTDDIGTHSMRKGSATYACFIRINCMSSFFICHSSHKKWLSGFTHHTCGRRPEVQIQGVLSSALSMSALVLWYPCCTHHTCSMNFN